MDERERTEINNLLGEVILDDFHTQFSEYYATVISIAEKHPVQVNNEIRNALNHIARALGADTFANAKDQADKARGHVDRASRDCLKLAIIHKRDQLKDDLIKTEDRYGIVPSAFKRRLKVFRKEREQILLQESKGEDGIVKSLGNLLADILDFEEQLYDKFPLPSSFSSNLHLYWRKFKTPVVGTLLFVLGLFAAGLFDEAARETGLMSSAWAGIKDSTCQIIGCEEEIKNLATPPPEGQPK